jgi:hypothetical protein
MSGIAVTITDDDIASGRADEILAGALAQAFPPEDRPPLEEA